MSSQLMPPLMLADCGHLGGQIQSGEEPSREDEGVTDGVWNGAPRNTLLTSARWMPQRARADAADVFSIRPSALTTS